MTEYLFARLTDVDAQAAIEARDEAVAAQLAAENAQSAAENAQTGAETAQGLAENAQAAAEQAAQDAAAAADNFDDVYLGSKAADPTLDNDGNALVEGQLYWNTSSNSLKVYDGSSWVNYSAQSGITSVVEDTSPQLGGDLDFNGFAALSTVGSTAAGTFRNTNDTANAKVLALQGLSPTPAANDIVYMSFELYNNAGTPEVTEYGRISVRASDITDGTEDGEIIFGVMENGTVTSELRLTLSSLMPWTSDGLGLGTTSAMWADLFLASGGAINWNNSDVTITHSANALAFAGASSGYDFDALLTITAGSPRLVLIDSDTGAEARIDANSSVGGLFIQADFNNMSANTVIRFDIDGTARLQLEPTALRPSTNDLLALGTATQMWSDLFLASGSVINWNNGDLTLTHGSNLLTLAGGNLSIGTSGVFTAGTIELGAASDTTLARDAAGWLSVEGNVQARRTPVAQAFSADFTLAATASGSIFWNDSTTSETVTVPTNTSVPMPVGTVITFVNRALGSVTVIDGDTGVTVNGSSGGSVTCSLRWQGLTLLKVGTDEWIVSGAID